MAPGMAEAIAGAARRTEAGMAPFGHGRLYRNFAEEETSAARFHEEARLARLRAVRRRVDPELRIQANHPIDRGADAR